MAGAASEDIQEERRPAEGEASDVSPSHSSSARKQQSQQDRGQQYAELVSGQQEEAQSLLRQVRSSTPGAEASLSVEAGVANTMLECLHGPQQQGCKPDRSSKAGGQRYTCWADAMHAAAQLLYPKKLSNRYMGLTLCCPYSFTARTCPLRWTVGRTARPAMAAAVMERSQC